MNKEKTESYYKNLKEEDLCTCRYCKNYRKEIKIQYPLLASYLDDLGINIKKPFETNPWEPENGQIVYDPVQYVVLGDKRDFEKTIIKGLTIELADSYPDTGIEEEHFVIDIYPIKLVYTT